MTVRGLELGGEREFEGRRDSKEAGRSEPGCSNTWREEDGEGKGSEVRREEIAKAKSSARAGG